MSNWEWKKLGDVCEFQGGAQPPKEEWIKENRSGYIRMLQIRDFTQSRNFDIEYVKKTSKLRICNENDILLGRYGASVGKVLTGLSGAYNVAIVKTIPNSEYSKLFIKYYFQSPLFQTRLLNLCNQRTAQAGFNKEDIYDFPIPYISLNEQKHVVKTLDEKFAKIDKLKTAAETNLKKAGAIFDAELKKEFNNKKWDSKKLNDLCELISGYAFDSKGYSSKNEDTLLVCGDNIMHCSFRWETVKRWPKEKCYELKRFELKDSDIVLAMDRPWIKSGLKISKITGNELPSLLVQRTAALRTTSHVSSDYLYYALQEKKFSDYLIDQQTGSGVPHISGKQILNFQIPLPPLSVQKEIVARLDKLSENVKRLETNYKQIIANCDELKKSILKKTFEGDSRSSRE